MMAKSPHLLGRLLRRVTVYVRVWGVGIEGCCRGSEGLVCHFEVAHSVINITDYEFGTSTAENESRREGAFVHLCRVEVVRTYRYI